ncbi:MAG TPA: ABC transporter permease [Blastocatellia bacterium]|nr:ABC transporter permease [Blastocatellia bacterium]
MPLLARCKRLFARPHLRLIALVGVIVPRRLRADWRQEWEAELRYREALLAEWDRLDWRYKLDLLRRSTSAFRDALLLQPKRLEDDMFQDLRFGARMMSRDKGFAAVVVITLALGVGASTAIFSVVRSVLLRPLPYAQPDRLLQFRFYYLPPVNHEQTWVAIRDVVDWREQSRSFERIGVYGYAVLNFSEDGLPEAVYGLRVSADLLPALGVPPAMGRYFSPEEDQPGRNHVIILSDDLWRRRFGADPGIVGKTVRANQENYTVVGVMPAGFNFPLRMATTVRLPSQQMGYWYPLGLDARRSSRAEAGYGAIARLKPGATFAQAQAEMEQIAARLAGQYPQTNAGRELRMVPLKDQFVGDVRLTLIILLGAVALVVLIACANIASLLLVRADGRRREMAIRQSLGAGRLRLVRQALTESMLLALSGGAVGVLLARWALPTLLRLSPQAIPRLAETRVDGSVLGFTLAVSILAGLIFGLAPAWAAAKGGLNEVLKQSPGTSSGKRGAGGRALIVVEVALTLILTLGAGLLLNSFIRLMNVDLGFRADQVLAAIILPPNSRYPNVKAKVEFYRRVIERVKGLPGVESVAASDTLPYSGQNGTDQVRIEGRPPADGIDPNLYCEGSTVTNDFRQTMGIPLVRGRFFNEHDTADAPPVIVISEAAAERYWPGEDPIGKRMAFSADGYRVWRQVVGIVKSTHNLGLDQPQFPHFYLPVEQWPLPANFLLVRSALPSQNLAGAVRQAVAAVDREQPVFLAAPLESWVADSVAGRRFGLLLLGLFGALALALASVGIYGVVSYAATRRTREIGIRMALGAQSGDVLRLVIRQGMRPVLLGVAVGLPGAVALTRLLRSLLFGVSATDPLTFILVATLLGGVALLACWLPARRAAKVSPLVALRHE